MQQELPGGGSKSEDHPCMQENPNKKVGDKRSNLDRTSTYKALKPKQMLLD